MDYGKDLKIVYKNLVVHPGSATIPAQAACAAGRQGKFAAMEKLIWEKGFNAGRNLGRDNMDKLAKEAGLRMSKYVRDIDGACVAIVRQDQEEMRRVGARGTPAFFINGRFLSGARPIGQFKTLIDEELAKANDRIKRGSSVRGYYDEWVLAKGKKQL